MSQVCANQFWTNNGLAASEAMFTAPSNWFGRVTAIDIPFGHLPQREPRLHTRQFTLLAVVKLTRQLAPNQQAVRADLFSPGFGKPGIRVDKAHCPETTEMVATTNTEVRGHCEFFAHCSHCWRVEDDKRKAAERMPVIEETTSKATLPIRIIGQVSDCEDNVQRRLDSAVLDH